MSYERKDNSGALFRNDKRETDRHPLYKGSAVVDGKEYFLDAWLNESRDGSKYMSVKFKLKDQQREPVRDTAYDRSSRADVTDDPRLGIVPYGQKHDAEIDDEIPF